MSIASEITRLERKVEDLEQHHAVALNERTGRAPGLMAEIEATRGRIEALRPFAEPPIPAGPRMVPCAGCGKPIWPESERCDACDRLGPEEPSESIQNVRRKGTRVPKD